MVDTGVMDLQNTLKNTINELCQNQTVRNQLDNLQQEHFLKKCQIFDTTMTVEELRI